MKAKVESLVAHLSADQDVVTETETNRFKSAAIRFHRIFNLPLEEKLVNCRYFGFWYFINGEYLVATIVNVFGVNEMNENKGCTSEPNILLSYRKLISQPWSHK